MPPRRRAVLATGACALAGCLGRASRRETPACPAAVGTDVDARLGFVGDVMLGRGVTERWRDADPAGVWGTTLSRLGELDGLVLNLECCVSADGERWPDKTYYFRADPAFATGALDAADVTAVSLANNHALDFGAAALSDTRSHLDEVGVAHAGAGPDAAAAASPAVADAGELSVAVLALTDQYAPFRAGPDSPGTAYDDLDVDTGATREAVSAALETADDRDADLVVASLHWGPNWVTEPAARYRRFARSLLDAGVDVVHGHSAHVVQGVETYRGRPILHDTGDFVDDYLYRDDVDNKRGFLFELVVEGGRLAALDLVPTTIRDERAMLADETVAGELRETMRDRSEALGTTVERAGGGLRVPLSC